MLVTRTQTHWSTGAFQRAMRISVLELCGWGESPCSMCWKHTDTPMKDEHIGRNQQDRGTVWQLLAYQIARWELGPVWACVFFNPHSYGLDELNLSEVVRNRWGCAVFFFCLRWQCRKHFNFSLSSQLFLFNLTLPMFTPSDLPFPCLLVITVFFYLLAFLNMFADLFGQHGRYSNLSAHAPYSSYRLSLSIHGQWHTSTL